MLSLVCSMLLSSALVQDPVAPVAPVADAKADLVKACEAFAKAKSYAFELSAEGTGGRGRRDEDAGGTPAPRPPVVTKGQFQNGLPMHLVQGDVEGFLQADVLVTKNADGTFEKLDREAMRGRGMRPGRVPRNSDGGTPPATPPAAGGAAGEGTPPATGGAEPPKTDGGAQPPPAAGTGGPPRGDGGGSDRPREGRGGGFGAMGLLQIRAPHRLVETVGASVDGVTKTERDGKVVYSGQLTEAAIDALSPMGGMRGNRGGGDGGEAPERTAKGTFEIVIGGNGAIESIMLDTHTSTTFGERTMEQKRKSTYTITDLDRVEVVVPESAKKLFEV